VLAGEIAVTGGAAGIDAGQDRAGPLDAFVAVTQLAELARSSRRVVGRVEDQNHWPAPVALQLKSSFTGVGAAETGGFGSGFEEPGGERPEHPVQCKPDGRSSSPPSLLSLKFVYTSGPCG